VILALVVFLSMAPMDTAAAMKITYLERHHPWRAGLCEVVSDYGGVLSYGVGGVACLRYRLSITTGVIFVALGTASILGTVLGHRLTNRSVA
jgi:hypothetical protein